MEDEEGQDGRQQVARNMTGREPKGKHYYQGKSIS